MADKTQKQKIDDMYTSILGVEGTEDTGLYGDVKEIRKDLKTVNGAVRSNTTWRKAHTWAIGIIASIIVAGVVTAITVAVNGN